MVSRWTIANECKHWASIGHGVDVDGAYGMQCVDLPNYMSRKYFGRSMWGNGNQMIDAGRANGYQIIGKNEWPKAGDIFCEMYGGYGHTGIIVEDYNGSGTVVSVEQNYGTNGYGGPARLVHRNYATFVNGSGQLGGYVRMPYDDINSSTSGQGATQTKSKNKEKKPEKPENPWKDTEMNFIFNIKDDKKNFNPNAMYYYNGAINEIQGIHSQEELKFLQQVYKDCTGRDLKIYAWSGKVAPVYLRLFGVLKPGSQDDAVMNKLKELEKELNAAVG